MKRAEQTRARLLDAAERLFGEKGVQATSLRMITSAARSNLASVHYHFGSKTGLLYAVIARRVDAVNAVRLQRLEEALAGTGRRAPKLDDILRAFIAPTIDLCSTHPAFVRLAGRLHYDPKPAVQKFFLSRFETVIIRFREAFRRTLPRLSDADFFWRLHFLLGALIHTWTNHIYLEHISLGLCSVRENSELVELLVDHGKATLTAKPSRRPRPQRKRRKQ